MVTTAGEPTGAGVTPGAALRCRGCGGGAPRRVVDLGRQPASDDFPQVTAPEPDARRPLELWWCPDCTLTQLGPAQAGRAEAAGREEPVRAVESATSRRHAVEVAAAVLAGWPELAGGAVREYSSHHGGSWLAALTGLGCRLAEPGEPAALVVDAHALAHTEDLAGGLAERAAGLAPGGLLVVEHHHLLPLVEGGQYDTVRHGHWSYLSLTALQRLARGHGLQVVEAVPAPVFGGSLRVGLAPVAAGRPTDASVARVLAAEEAAGLVDGSGLAAFGDRALTAAAALAAYLHRQRAAGRRVLGYGAPSKAAVLLGVSGVGPGLLEFTVDAAPLKHGRAIPGVRVPIRPVPDLEAARPAAVLILTWDIADEVVSQLEASGGWGAEYVVPVPLPHPLPSPGAGGAR